MEEYHALSARIERLSAQLQVRPIACSAMQRTVEGDGLVRGAIGWLSEAHVNGRMLRRMLHAAMVPW